MKFTCSQKDFKDALSLVNRAVSGRSTLPVLNNVLIEVKGGKIKLSTTNLEVAITHWLEGEIENEGSVTVPVKLISQYISLLNSEKVKIELLEGETLHLKSEGSDTKIKGISADEFPMIPQLDEGDEFTVATSVLYEAIKQVGFAAAMDEARPVLAGVYFTSQKDKLILVATDSYRLAEKKIEVKTGKEVKAVVPSKTMAELARVIPQYEENLNIKVSNNQIMFKFSNLQIISRLIDGQYPPYEQIIPSSAKLKLTINTELLSQVLKRVNLFAEEGGHNVKLKIKNKGLEVVADTDQIGNEIASITDIKTEGDSLEIAFNAIYLLEALANMGSEEVKLEFNTETSPTLIRPVGKEDHLHIVMPLKA
ncbi:MAG: DNA polymerase III subunit beta [Candidatus Gracilibacteria bacterium]|nr:DNA polymerase III subunit beta [Candidatus Gracilibacteria bacterium]